MYPTSVFVYLSDDWLDNNIRRYPGTNKQQCGAENQSIIRIGNTNVFSLFIKTRAQRTRSGVCPDRSRHLVRNFRNGLKTVSSLAPLRMLCCTRQRKHTTAFFFFFLVYTMKTISCLIVTCKTAKVQGQGPWFLCMCVHLATMILGDKMLLLGPIISPSCALVFTLLILCFGG